MTDPKIFQLILTDMLLRREGREYISQANTLEALKYAASGYSIQGGISRSGNVAVRIGKPGEKWSNVQPYTVVTFDPLYGVGAIGNVDVETPEVVERLIEI